MYSYDIHRTSREIEKAMEEKRTAAADSPGKPKRGLGKTLGELMTESRKDTVDRLNALFSGVHHE